MKTLYEIFKILSVVVGCIWLPLTFRTLLHLRAFLKVDNDYQQLLFLRKITKRSCFFALLLGIIYFILTALEFFLKIELNYNIIGLLFLSCYFSDRYKLSRINKSIEAKERFFSKK